MKPRYIALVLATVSLLAVGSPPAMGSDEASESHSPPINIHSEAAAVARQWIKLYNDGTPSYYGSDRFLDLYAEDCIWIEYPSKLFPAGRKGGVAEIRVALADAQSVLVDRHVVLHEITANRTRVAMRYTWSATVNGPLLDYPMGSRISYEVAAFFKIRDGRITEAREFVAESSP